VAALVSLALSAQSVDGRDKKDDKKDSKSDTVRGQSSAPARVSSSSHGKQHVASSSQGKQRVTSPSHEKQHVASSTHGKSQQRIASSSSRGSDNTKRLEKSSGGPSVHQRSSVAHSSHQKAPKDLVALDSHSRSGIDRQRGYSSKRGMDETVSKHNLASRGQSDKIRVDKQHGSRAVDRGFDRSQTLAQTDRSSRVYGSSSNRVYDSGSSRVYNSGSRRIYDSAHHSTWYRNAGDYRLGVWRGDTDWYPDRSWAWHNQHRFFWNGAWVIGIYPSFGYDPGYYTYDPRPLYPVDSTGVVVQRALADAGYYNGPIDGIVGYGTRGAIADYQNDHNLPVTGLIDDELMSSLGLI